VATVDGTSGGSPLVGRAAERATVDAILAGRPRLATEAEELRANTELTHAIQ
jgi:hypothetical protein